MPAVSLVAPAPACSGGEDGDGITRAGARVWRTAHNVGWAPRHKSGRIRETHSRVLASCAASSPDTACRETVARQPTREPLASSTVMGESEPRCSGPMTEY